VNSSPLLSLILLASILSSAAFAASGLPENKATRWFQQELPSLISPSIGDSTAPRIYGIHVAPSVLKCGDPRSEINAFIYDPAGIEMAYADIGNRMNLMLDLDLDKRFTGYCGSNLPAGTYKVTIVAIDKAGNAARDESGQITILDPRDLNGNRIEDSLEKQGKEEQKVIILHDGNVSGLAADRLKILPGSAMLLPCDKLSEISKIKGVKGIYKDQKLKVLSSPAGQGENPSSISGINVDDPRSGQSLKGDGMTVALIDTGTDPRHESLKERVLAFKDFVNNQSEPYDDNGHGTHCASLIAGEGVGVAPESRLVVVKVMDRDGACYLSDALKALDWCVENKDRYGIKIVSFSVGGENPSDGSSLLDEACNRMVDEGMVMCVAAGNSGPTPGSIVIPGDAEKVITVGAIDTRGSIFEKSSRGPAASGEIKPDVVTLGVDVVSALAGSTDDYSSMSGTSMAVPQVSGAAALLLEAQPDLEPADVKRILLKTADDLGPHGPDNIYGYGALNLTDALESMQAASVGLAAPSLEELKLSRQSASVGDPVMIEVEASGDLKGIDTHIIGPDRTLEIPMDDFDSNGVYSARWETSFWTPGDYKVKAELLGRYGEVETRAVPFHLDPKG
jgi:serine protease AprX